MPHRRRFWGAATRFAGVLLVAPLLLAARPASAQTGEGAADSFTVRDVQVDVTADNVNLARQQAFAQGQRQAFDRLMQRFTVPDEAAHLPEIGDAELDDLVLDVGVDQEKRSSVRYLATLSVRFKPDAVRRLLRTAGIAYVEWRGRPVIVLPVLKTENGPILWEAANPWRDAWNSAAAQGLVPLLVPPPPPAGQFPDDALQAATAGPDVIAAFAARFGAADLLVATGVIGRGDDGRATFDVALAGEGPLGGAISGTRNWQGETGEAIETVMRRAVAAIAAAINDAYKNDNMVPAGEATSLAVMVPLDGLAAWTTLRERLTRTTAVRGWEVGALSQTSASLVLHYVGQQPQLEAALVQNGLVLSWAEDHWILQTAQAKPATAP